MLDKKLMALPLLLVLSISLTGVAFASWSQQVTINGTVKTSYISAKFLSVFEPLQTDPLHVATATATITNDKQLQITLNNVYSGYSADIAFKTINDGPLPITFSGVSLNNGPVSPSTIPWVGNIAGGTITLSMPASGGVRIGPGEKGSYDLTIDIGDVPLDGSSYSFTIDLIYQQSA